MHSEYKRIVPGAKTAVLMVHGIAGTPRHFDFLLEVIPPEVSIHNVLLPGHGGTVQDFGRSSMKAWKEKVQQAMAALCAAHEQVILVAHSMGTLLTAEAMAQHPQVKGALYLNVPLHVWVAPRMVPSSLRWSFGALREGNLTDEGLRLAAGAAPDKRLWRYLAWLPRFWELLVLCRQSRHRFETLQLPVIAFQSHDDELVRRSSSRHLLKNPAIIHTMLPGCGHFFYPPQVQAQMRQALRQLLEKAE